jgi:FG-GAP-like repeat
MQNRYRRSLLVGLVLLAAARGDAKPAPATSDAAEICPAVVRDNEPNRVPVTTGLLSGVTFSSDRTQLPSTGTGSGRQAMDICRINADGNLTWHGNAAARVEVRPGDNPLALGVKTASSGTQGFDHGGDVNGRSDVLWDGPTARVTRVALREQQASGTNNGLASNTTNTHDFNGDGKSDILWRNTNGDVDVWLMNGMQILSGTDFANVSTGWSIVGTGDFNGDGKSDILWRNTNGDVDIWLMNGFQILSATDFANVSTDWSIVGTGDFNGDGKSDILWRNTNGDVDIWLMNGF